MPLSSSARQSKRTATSTWFGHLGPEHAAPGSGDRLNGICIGAFDKERIKQEFHLAYEPLLILAVGKGIEKIELVPIGPGDSHTYYRENGTHYVPKLRAEELTIKE